MALQELAPERLPSAWREEAPLSLGGSTGRVYKHRDGLRAVLSVDLIADKRWLHLSISRTDRLPRWQDLVNAKELFIGKERCAVQVIPPRSEYVNLHEYCLHCWHCLDGETVPNALEGA